SIVHDTGCVHVNAAPLVCVNETKVVFGGTWSVSVTFFASAGPLLAMVIAYVVLVFAVADPVLAVVTARSASMLPTLVDPDAELSSGSASTVESLTLAVLVIVPEGAPLSTFATISKVADA